MICLATASGPGPGRLRKLCPSTPSSVVMVSTPMGRRPSLTPNTASVSERRSCRTTLTSVMRMWFSAGSASSLLTLRSSHPPAALRSCRGVIA